MSERHLIEGEHLYLREVHLSDVNEDYHRWMNDSEVTQYLESRFYPNSVEKLRDYVISTLAEQDSIFLAITLKDGDRHIGNIKLGPINWNHKFGDIGIMIGDRANWGKGYATEAIKLLVDYAFRKLKLHKVTAGCYANNQGALKAFKKAGFQVEVVRKKHLFCNGKYVDGILLGIIRK